MIEIKDVVKKYGDHIILNHINLKINDGEMVAIVGPSGSGKSTLLNIMGLLEELDEGEVLYDGENVEYQSRKATLMMRNKIAYLFQNFALVDDMSVYENLLIALKYTKYSKEEKISLIRSALKNVGLSKSINRQIYTLSGGEQQRVALARVLIKESNMILCDEPTGSLDKENGQIILDLLFKCKKEGKTIIIVTHDESIAKQCDRIIEIN